ARLTTNGTVDESFNVTVDGGVQGLAQQPDGKILVSGSFTELQGVPCNGVGRLLPDGEIDTNFDVGSLFETNGTPFRLAVQPDGKILVSTLLPAAGGLLRLNTNGTLDDTFVQTNAFWSYWIHKLLVHTNGTIFVGGGFDYVNDFHSPGMVLLDSSG